MIWLLDLVDDHQAAVRYDLLKHGYRLADLGTPALTWGDALTVLACQPPATSAVWRELHPEEHDTSAVTRGLERAVVRLEAITVILVQSQLLSGNQSGVKQNDLPVRFEQLFEEVKRQPVADGLLTLDEIDALMGWNQ